LDRLTVVGGYNTYKKWNNDKKWNKICIFQEISHCTKSILFPIKLNVNSKVLIFTLIKICKSIQNYWIVQYILKIDPHIICKYIFSLG